MDNDKWERRRRELLHKFLVNPGFQLSPIPEEDRSSSSDTGSLPDLIVEPERNRHDHSPEFYVGLEQRMKRLYRQLFLNENNSEDESCNLEVNQSMASTSSDTRKDNTMDTCATYDADDTIQITSLDDLSMSTHDVEGVSEDSSRSQCCHRTTTIADIHDSPKRGSVQFDNGSPVLIPRMLKFGRTVFGSGIGSRLSGKQSNKSETDLPRLKDSGVTKIRMDSTFTIHNQEDAVDKSYEKNTEESFETVELIGHSTENSINEHLGPVEEIREARGSGDVSWHGDTEQTSSTLAFEAKSSQDKLEDMSVNSNEIDASIEDENAMSVEEDKSEKSINVDLEPVEEMRKARGSGDVSWHGDTEQTSSTLAFEAKSSQDKLEDVSDNSSNLEEHNYARIIDDFWSASSVEVNSSQKKGRSDSSDADDTPPDRTFNIILPGQDKLEDVSDNSSNLEEHNYARIIDDFWSASSVEVNSSQKKGRSDSSDADDTPPDRTFNIILPGQDKLEDVSDNSSNLEEHNCARIIDDFWSASSVEVNSSRKKRRSDSSDADDAPPSKKKKDVATQVTSGFALGDNLNWGRATTELFVGSPLVFRLCRCQNHTCS